MDVADYVVARRRIAQSPLDNAPDVPMGTRGHVEDYDDDDLTLVDFGDPYGVVIVEPGDVL